ncbi:acyl-CoA thioesterase [Algimonas arctica]|uniref:Acyl-CoA thioesterase n=1 Tax=Algimonas arctica TaxID=1479486 RepID=A0A8J3G1X7_9PROT|nr:thioesterase family protein [Algimonas arctica]GHA88971.1 acyl-CoA thioesterase [Algimonas arctica]
MNQTFQTLVEQAATRSPDLPESWKQGRTAYGGLSAALLLARARGDHSDLPPLRSALVNFTGPVTSSPEITTEVLRQGRNVTTIYARADVEGRAVCTATFSFGAARDSHLSVDCPATHTPHPDACAPYTEDGSAFVPPFLRNFETRLIEGTRPMEGGTKGYLRMWARHSDPASRDGEISLLCLADILPPATFPIMKKMGPVSSMTWICNFLSEPKTQDGWYMIEAELTAARDGYSSQVMRIWNTDGDIIVDGMQSIAVFV